MTVPAHLGGWVPGGDPATLFPDLWEWLVEEAGVESVLDIGCGDGQAIEAFNRLGARAAGVEGDPVAIDAIIARWLAEPEPRDRPTAIHHDYTGGPLIVAELAGGAYTKGSDPSARTSSFDLAWSCEFVEHVAEEHLANYVATFQQARLLLMTHAAPGQAGHHHVNCRPADYWVGVMAAAGFRLDAALTEKTRILAALNTNPWNHYAARGLAFRRLS